MGTKYETILVGGVVQTYNDNPPADDGSQTEANRVKYVTVTDDLTAPLHSAIINMDGKLATFVDEGPTPKSGTYTTILSDHNSVIECSGTFTLSLLNPTGNAGYKVTAKNAGVGTVTVDVDGGANVDGAASIPLSAGEARTFYVNAAATAYYSASGQLDTFPTGTVMLFYQNTAPTGWTILQALDEHAVRLTKGSGAAGQAGGTTGGTHNFSTQFASLAEGATPGVGDHTLIISEMPGHTHTYSRPNTAGNTIVEAQATAGTVSPGVSTGSTGGDGAHGHTVDLRAKWAAFIAATKD